MKKFVLIAFCALATLGLSGCITQDQADIKMVKGCAAGVESLITPRKIQEIKMQRYANEQVEGGLHRRITLEVLEKDGWVELDKEYSCLFMQQWGFFKSSHDALLVQVKFDDEIIGKKEGVLTGSFENFLALTRVVDAAMGQ